MLGFIGSILLFGYFVWQVVALIWFANECRDIARSEREQRWQRSQRSQRPPGA